MERCGIDMPHTCYALLPTLWGRTIGLAVEFCPFLLILINDPQPAPWSAGTFATEKEDADEPQ